MLIDMTGLKKGLEVLIVHPELHNPVEYQRKNDHQQQNPAKNL
jgi:hypothetical protein